jgi:hypothetical protein
MFLNLGAKKYKSRMHSQEPIPIHNNLECMYKSTKCKCMSAWIGNLQTYTLLFMAHSQTYLC